MKKLILLSAIIVIVWRVVSGLGRVTTGPGVKAEEPPRQTNIESPSSLSLGDYRITPLAEFRIRAKVLARKKYSFGREADLSPMDFALGWGSMSDEVVVDQIDVSQSGRWYRWRTESLPIPLREIATHSANMHLIPANSEVEADMNQARRGDIIQLTGKLVEVKASDGWHWKSSLTRDDTGARSCELVWVDEFEIVEL